MVESRQDEDITHTYLSSEDHAGSRKIRWLVADEEEQPNDALLGWSSPRRSPCIDQGTRHLQHDYCTRLDTSLGQFSRLERVNSHYPQIYLAIHILDTQLASNSTLGGLIDPAPISLDQQLLPSPCPTTTLRLRQTRKSPAMCRFLVSNNLHIFTSLHHLRRHSDPLRAS